MDSFWLAATWSLLPTAVICLVGYLILRGILRSDRNERKAYQKAEAQERAARGLPPRVS